MGELSSDRRSDRDFQSRSPDPGDSTNAIDWGQYVDAVAPGLGINLDSNHRLGTIEQMSRLGELAQDLLAFEFPESTQSALHFEP